VNGWYVISILFFLVNSDDMRNIVEVLFKPVQDKLKIPYSFIK